MTTRRSLLWLGCSCLLAIGLMLPVPLRAQEPEKKESRGIIIQLDGKRGLILQDRSPDQELMELLQRALKILARKSQAPPADKAEAIKNAKSQVDALLRERELVEARLRVAQARLAQLQGKGKSGAETPLRFQLQFQPAPRSKKPTEPKAKGIGIFSGDLELRIQDGKIIGLQKEKRLQADELQQRLDRLRREIEELARDIQRFRSQKK